MKWTYKIPRFQWHYHITYQRSNQSGKDITFYITISLIKETYQNTAHSVGHLPTFLYNSKCSTFYMATPNFSLQLKFPKQFKYPNTYTFFLCQWTPATHIFIHIHNNSNTTQTSITIQIFNPSQVSIYIHFLPIPMNTYNTDFHPYT